MPLAFSMGDHFPKERMQKWFTGSLNEKHRGRLFTLHYAFKAFPCHMVMFQCVTGAIEAFGVTYGGDFDLGEHG